MMYINDFFKLLFIGIRLLKNTVLRLNLGILVHLGNDYVNIYYC